MELKFYKEEGKWYIDIPWDGDKSGSRCIT